MNTMRSHTREVLDCVRGEHDRRRPVGQLAQVGEQLRARDRVEAGCRLVQEEDVRIGEQLDRDAGALALPTAQRADPDVGLLSQADGVDRGTYRVVDLRRPWPTTGAAAAPRSGAFVAAADRHG